MKAVSLALTLFLVLTLSAQSQGHETRIEVKTPPTTDAVTVEISPDGEMLVVSGEEDGKRALWLISIASGEQRKLPGTDDISNPFPCWSPDSRSVVYAAGSGATLMRIDLEATAPRTLGGIGSALRGCSWNRDGTILISAAANPAIGRISENGGAARAATPRDPLYFQSPRFLPDGRHFLYFAGGAVWATELGSNTPPVQLIQADSAAAYSRTGHLLFVRGENLYAQPFDAESLKLSGQPSQLAAHVPAAANIPALSVSAKGDIAYRSVPDGGTKRQFKWFDRSGKELGKLGEPLAPSAGAPVFSPDRDTIALNLTTNGNQDIWLMDVATGALTRLTNSPSGEGFPVWSHDGKSIYYASNKTGQFELYQSDISDNASEKLVLRNSALRLPRDLSPDGRFLLFRSAGSIFALQLDGNPPGEIQIEAGQDVPQFSPDGRWYAFQSTEAGRVEVSIQKFPSGRRFRVSMDGGAHPRWNPNGKELFYIAPNGKLMAVPMELDSENEQVRVSAAVALFTPSLIGNIGSSAFLQQYLVSSDGERFLIATAQKIETPITVIRNWQPKP
jgi:Tol biopolymer transport system component